MKYLVVKGIKEMKGKFFLEQETIRLVANGVEDMEDAEEAI